MIYKISVFKGVLTSCSANNFKILISCEFDNHKSVDILQHKN